jgi:pSer/pThr/pTyr-binding forkhead associated (FHA) protein
MRFENIRTGEIVSMSDGLTIGRHPDNGYVLDESSVSRHHARIEWRHDCFFLIDLNSSNGCFANGVRAQEIRLKGEVLVGIGDIQLQFSTEIENSHTSPAVAKAEKKNRRLGRREIIEKENVDRIGDISQQSFGVRMLLYLLAAFVMYGVFALVRYAGASF